MNAQQPTTALQRIDTLKVALNDNFVQSQMTAVLKDNAQSFAASLIELYSNDKYLQECDPKQVIMQALKAAALKLPVIKTLGYAWIVAYKGAPQFQIGWKGLLQLAIRTGEFRIINADKVYEGEYRTTNRLTGEFDLSGMATSETVIGYFAHFELKNGFSKTLYMSKERVTSHAAKYSKSFNTAGTPWKTEFDAMAIKTVLVNLLKKWAPLSVEMQEAIAGDEDVADKVQNEISGKANRQEMGFEKVEEAEQVNNFQQPTRAPF